jgi:outer membrane protein
MKKTFVLMLALVLSTATASFAQKFGYCNSLALLSELPEVKSADSDLQAYQAQLQKKGQDMVKDLQEKAAELKRKTDQGLIAPKDAADQEAKLQAGEAEINKYAQTMEEDLGKKRELLYKPILDKVNKAMKEVAIEGNYLLVFDVSTQVLLYADETLDVTKQVQAKLAAMPAGN